MNLDLFSTKSLLEQEYILKYFYLLDPDTIATEVHSELEQKGIVKLDIDSENIELFFHTLFDHVYTHAYQYVKFIPTTGFMDSFFGEITAEQDKDDNFYWLLSALAALLKLSLYNYCISEGFFHYLEQDYFYNDPKRCSPLSVKYEDYFNSGFFSNPDYKKSTDLNSDPTDDRRQNWWYHKNNVKGKNKQDFIHFVFNDCKKIVTSTSSEIYVPWIYKFPIYTYFKGNAVNALSHNLSSHTKSATRTTLSLYAQLYDELLHAPKNAHSFSATDAYLFHTLNERYFGFSTFSYITDISSDIDGSKTDLESVPSKFAGTDFNNLLENLALCPLVYSRHFFLHYALEALKDNDTLETKYLQYTPQSMMTRSGPNKVLNNIQKSLRGKELLEQFFQTLNQMVLPIFSALWKTTLQHLVPDFMRKEPTQYFQSYIEKHLRLLTADFTHLSHEDILGCCGKASPIDNSDFFWNHIVHNIEALCLTEPPTNTHDLQRSLPPDHAFYSDHFFKAANNSFKSSLLREFLLRPMKSSVEGSKGFYPFSYISQKKASETKEPADIEVYNFQYKRAQEIFRLFHE